jgi:endoglucanase
MRQYLLYLVSLASIFSADACAEQPQQIEDSSVQLNAVGYQPRAPKLANSPQEIDGFLIRDVKTNHEVLRGKASRIAYSSATQPLYEIDFSAISAAGTYRIEIPNQRSVEFRVATDVCNWPFYCATRALYLSRCGTRVSTVIGDDRFEHDPCHMKDGYADFTGGPAGKQRDGVGGWHDAGDYNKYTVNAAFSLGLLLTAWEHFEPTLRGLKLDIPESSNKTPDVLDEARWELTWLLKMQAGDGSVYHKVSTRKFGGFVTPEKDNEPRYFSPWSSAATAAFVAVTAQSARVFREFDPKLSARCLTAAQESYRFLQAHPEDHRPDLSAFEIGPYVAPDPDDRLWAAAEIWETTGDPGTLQDCEARLTVSKTNTGPAFVTVDSDWDWSNVRNLGAFTYLRSKRPGRNAAIVARVREDTLRIADSIVDSAAQHPYRRPLGNKYYWGCNGTVARQAINLNVAYERTNDLRYRDTMLDALNHLFGRNPYGRSYVTGLGHKPPLFPHDRRSGADNVENPWPGYLVGGPWPGPMDWIDKQDSYQTNEIAINWNTSLIYALAAFVEPPTFDESVRRELSASRASSIKSQ